MTPSLQTITLAIGGILFIVGLFFRICPPKKINSLYGYRTFSSMRNSDTWTNANKYSASLMVTEGIILTLIGIITLRIPGSRVMGPVLGFALFIVSIIILIVATEKHLNKLFDKDGNRKSVK